MKTVILTSTLIGIATLAVAHSGVTNPAVMARMHVMKDMQDATKTLGSMVKGARAFDLEESRSAFLAIQAHAAETPDLFRAEENDPKSEALPVIWDEFDRFVRESEALDHLAGELAESISDLESLKPALAQLGKACKSCHEKYRE